MAGAAVIRHLHSAYGRTSSVWIGILLTTLANFILSGALAVVIAQLVADLISRTASPSLSLALLLALLLLAAGLNVAADYVFVKGTDSRYKDLVAWFYRDLMRRDPGFFRDEKVGALNALFRDYMDGTINVFRILRTDVVPALCAVVLPILVLTYFDVRLAGVVLVGALTQIGMSLWSARRVRALRADAHKVYRELSGVMADHVVHLAVIRAAGRAQEGGEKVERLANKEAVLFWLRHNAVIRFDAVKAFVYAMCLTGVFAVMVRSYHGRQAVTKLAVLAAIYVGQSMTSAHGYAEVVQRISEHWSRIASALRVLHRRSNEMVWAVEAAGQDELVRDGEVVFDRVGFSYRDSNTSSDRVVFSELSLTVPDGHHMALVGESGAGKSTLAHLLLRFDDVTSGAIRFGGEDLRTIPARRLYRSISYVPQQPDLLNTTVLDNLLLFAPDASEDDVWRACKTACAEEFIRKLKGGLNYQVGELGARLSGGERQRVALARALLREAKLYVFDEVTSALDDETAVNVVMNLRSTLRGRSVILMAHSPQVADLMERALVVEELQVHRRGFRGTEALF